MRVAENLNAALHGVLEADPTAYVIGEDILDPYGGAFKVTKGLSNRFPGRVLGTPISEAGITGLAAGLALCGDTAIVEIMFGDFVALAFDPIVNFAAKSGSMYGSRVPMRMIVRCPTGGGRGYGPTHSQSMQKHFIGVPGLSVYEMSPLHDNRAVMNAMLASGEPSMFFEDKVLYTRTMYDVCEPFRYDMVTAGTAGVDVARVFLDDPEATDCVIIAPGGMVDRVTRAMRALLLEREVTCCLYVPSRLYPLDLFDSSDPAGSLDALRGSGGSGGGPGFAEAGGSHRPGPPGSAGSPGASGTESLLSGLRRARAVLVVEEGTAGGTWGSEVAHRIHRLMWRDLRGPVRQVSSADSVIPAAAHLESRVLVRESTIYDAVLEALRD
ncbi:alpha-ketoacid dehydrogenase subunit beta [Microtetraspora sp. AC03309]|uniref:alpha-ketoacid dehydrogenase subunit beta n=1 Tax=Microtetraspora sp. AC03309 TaxID=2779376 RepID=UPI001E3D4D85|nr:alpha-ketoacid dehydrogenase subunit beta [Microtetraspora sp. AC03309]